MASPKRPVRVGGASGGFSDRQRSIHDLAKNCEVDVIVGDWMSECTMVIHGSTKVNNSKTPDKIPAPTYDACFMGSIGPGLKVMQEKGVKLAVNAGASNPGLLARDVEKEIANRGLSLKVAYVEGDEVTEQFNELRKQGEKFVNHDSGKTIDEWGLDPICAQCYLGAMGIKAAFEAGADIVICGRVADAAPTVAAAAWWHGWGPEQFDELARALVAGHLIECSSYVCGGYYSGFKDLMDGCENLGFPVAAIESTGDCVISKEANTGGAVTVGTVISQLVYEIQGPLYYNSDVTACLEDIKVEQVGKDEVRVSGVKGLPPPPTTRVGITARGGYQAEFHYLFCGLDVEEKAQWTKKQILKSMGSNAEKFSVLKFQLVGRCPEDPEDQDAATVDFRVFVQARDPSVMGAGSMASMDGAFFTRWCLENFLQSAPGATCAPDLRPASAKPILEYWPALLPQSVIKQRAVLNWSGESIDIPTPTKTQTYDSQQPSYETKDPVDLVSFGPTTRAPLGYVVMGRSGDKASNANIGLFVRHDDEWDWLRSLLTKDKFIQLLAKEYLGHGLDRFELPNIKAVHFLVKDHLDRGFNSTSSLDSLGKNLCEYIRCRMVDIPNKFLERGRI